MVKPKETIADKESQQRNLREFVINLAYYFKRLTKFGRNLYTLFGSLVKGKQTHKDLNRVHMPPPDLTFIKNYVKYDEVKSNNKRIIR